MPLTLQNMHKSKEFYEEEAEEFSDAEDYVDNDDNLTEAMDDNQILLEEEGFMLGYNNSESEEDQEE